MISDYDAERAIEYLRKFAEEAAQARAHAVYMESWVKIVMAQEMAKHADIPIAAQEREARMSQAYLDALKAQEVAIELDCKHRFLREAASAKIAGWQTMSANERATRI